MGSRSHVGELFASKTSGGRLVGKGRKEKKGGRFQRKVVGQKRVGKKVV